MELDRKWTRTAGQLELIGQLRDALAAAEEADTSLPAEHDRRVRELESRISGAVQQEKSRARQLEVELRGEHLRLSSEAAQQHDQQLDEAQRLAGDDMKRLRANRRKQQQELEYQLFLGSRQLKRDLDAAKAREVQRHQRSLHELTELEQRCAEVQPDIESLMVLRRMTPGEYQAAVDSSAVRKLLPRDAAERSLARAEQGLDEVLSSRLSRSVDQRWCWVWGLMGGLGLLAWAALVARSPAQWLGFAVGLSAWSLLVVIGHLLLTWWARRTAQRQLPPLAQALADARGLLVRAREDELREHQEGLRTLVSQSKADLDQLRGAHFNQLRELDVNLELKISRVEDALADRRHRLSTELAGRNESLRRQYLPRIEQSKLQLDDRLQQLQSDRERDVERVAVDYRDRLQGAEQEWRNEWGLVQKQLDQSLEFVATRFPDWAQVVAEPIATVAQADRMLQLIPWGSYRTPVSELHAPASRHEGLVCPRTELDWPALLHLPDEAALVMEYGDSAGQTSATELLQAITLRMLTAIPAGQLRLTLIDPLGLGEGFSGFMHLQDYDERLVGARIWTEPAHIDQALWKLSERIEDVIQQYLRNEFKNVWDYNRQAGDVPVPLQLLVISGFPENFSEEACRWLSKIMVTGPRCGVVTLMGVDARAKLPRNVSLEVLASTSQRIEWRQGNWVRKQSELEKFPLSVLTRPREPRFSELVHEVGRAARAAQRVELAFELVAPSAGSWWAGSTANQLSVAIGRGPANRPQYLVLGEGTSQHALIAGKTGSGKSSLLHALITNAALNYSPQELQFYLMDFKKGVEFKAYAEHGLPHARVIAIESEREFGLSVLERLDRELQRRGELYRQVNAQTVADYRAARPDESLPRILLVVDEFQELFVSEDRIATDAALLLDRLVRQGRAFGMHVILGTQTLAGAYSLARSTIGQMTVRIALQCSAADAHLILSDENDAARWLKRPGEAIYNDANGRVEGNAEFQVVWLPGERRTDYLARLRELADARHLATEPAIVFEGSASAEIAENRLLQRTVEAPSPTSVPLAPRGWLGEAIAIKEPPAATFQRRSGSHLLVVGQNEEVAQSIVSACLTGLAAFVPTSDPAAGDGWATFELLLGRTEAARAEAGIWQPWLDAFGCWHHLHAATEATQVVERLAQTVAERRASQATQLAPIFLVLHDLQHFPQLRSREDDLGFSSWSDTPADSAGKWLSAILKDGPDVGVHVVAWADSYYRAKEFFDRAGLREFGMRVLLQMNALDSTQLIDQPAASQLGPYRALWYREADGTCERFRPYAPPSADWLQRIAQQLRNRGLVRS
ncbi:MAG: FtsK/SpoIIIE domain-containing protein [Pirellulales bacterium]